MREVLLVAVMLLSLTVSASSRLVNDGLVPWGAKVWCMERPEECKTVPAAKPIKYLLWESRIADVNLKVNQSFPYLAETWDRWDLSPAMGDCDDYAVTKRAELVKMGIPRADLQMAFVMHVTEGSHTVLLLNTDYGYKVLDNLSNEVYDLDQMMITRFSLQDGEHPRLWRQIF